MVKYDERALKIGVYLPFGAKSPLQFVHLDQNIFERAYLQCTAHNALNNFLKKYKSKQT